jgi:hypothetical protein
VSNYYREIRDVQYNFLPTNTFKVMFNRFPNLELYCQGAAIPEMSFQPLDVPWITNTVPYPGDKINYEPLALQFLVDVDLKVYEELYTWIKTLSYESTVSYTAEELAQSSCRILVLTPRFNINKTYEFQGIVPIQLGSLEFNATETDSQYMTCSVVFAYTKFIDVDLGI